MKTETTIAIPIKLTESPKIYLGGIFTPYPEEYTPKTIIATSKPAANSKIVENNIF
jgi:hypothetical protein